MGKPILPIQAVLTVHGSDMHAFQLSQYSLKYHLSLDKIVEISVTHSLLTSGASLMYKCHCYSFSSQIMMLKADAHHDQ